MSDTTLWINDADSTATVAGTNVSYTMPLWVFNVIRDIIWAEAEKEVEVTHSDFDTQQELLDRYRAENAKLRELLQRLLTEYRYMRVRPRAVYLQHEGRMRAIEEEMRELGVEVES